MAKKAAKGTVVIQVFRDRLRLVWTHNRKRYFLYLGLPDGRVNRIVAEAKAKLIEGDLATGNFDPTLNKYKEEAARSDRQRVTDLFGRFTEWKAKRVYHRTLEKYRALHKHLLEFFGEKRIDAISERDAEKFKDWLLQRMGPSTAKEYLVHLKACWNWAIKQELLSENVWEDVAVFKIPPKQSAKPFTREEMQAIILAFREDEVYHYYADAVEFMFCTGCRTGEAVGLKWKHLNEDCSQVWFGESVGRDRDRKGTKTNQARFVTLTNRLQQMLSARRPDDFDLEDSVFKTVRGCLIDHGNFRSRAWVKILNKLEIEYRKPYTTRKTMTSHALEIMSPAEVAEMTGNSVRTIYQHYAGSIRSRAVLPDILGDEID